MGSIDGKSYPKRSSYTFELLFLRKLIISPIATIIRSIISNALDSITSHLFCLEICPWDLKKGKIFRYCEVRAFSMVEDGTPINSSINDDTHLLRFAYFHVQLGGQVARTYVQTGGR